MHSHSLKGLTGTCLVFLLFLFLTPPSWAGEFFVAPSPQRTGDGSRQRPWDLQTALAHPPTVKPGDTIWLLNGTHRLKNRPTRFVSYLSGTPSQPITVRQFPGERAIIDGNLQQVFGGWVNYWGFEIMYSETNRVTAESGPFPRAWWKNYDGKTVDFCVSGFDLQAPNVKAINLLIHDSVGGGIGLSKSAQNTEIYGCLCYYNGWQAADRAHGHGFYGQNAAPFIKTVKESLFFENLGLGLQATGTGFDPVADNFYFEGNAFFMNGVLAKEHQANFLVGAFQGPGRNGWVIRNYVYDTNGTMSDSNMGYGGGLTNAIIRENYFGTSVLFSRANRNLTLTSNLFAAGTFELETNNFPNNTWLSNPPRTNFVVVRPNQYESGRAHIVIYNWEMRGEVSVDLTGIGLSDGDEYELHNAADFHGDVISGIYHGQAICVPMTNHTVAVPVGTNFRLPPSTFPKFGVFVIVKKWVTLSGNTPPTISSIASQTVLVGSPAPALSFSVGDAQTPAGDLLVSAASSNPILLPENSISLDGTNSERTILLIPAAGEMGSSTVTITVSDGTNSASTSFAFNVIPINDPPTITSVTNLTINANTECGPIVFQVHDTETAAADLGVEVHSANQELLPDTQIHLDRYASDCYLYLTPAAGRAGSSEIILRVSDPFACTTNRFTLRVNAWPKLSSLPERVIGANQTTVMKFTVSDAETAAEDLLVSAETSDPVSFPPENLQISGNGTNRFLALTPSPVGTDSFITVSVDDGHAVRRSTFTVHIDPPPTIAPIPDQTMVANNSAEIPISYGDEFYCPQGLSLTMHSSNPSLVSADRIVLGNNGLVETLTISPFPDQTGNSTITVKISDGFNSVTTSFLLTVTPLSGPVPRVPTSMVGTNASVLGFKAESGTITTPMLLSADPDYPARKYLCTAGLAAGSARFQIHVSEEGDYGLWCKLRGANKSTSRFTITLDRKSSWEVTAAGLHSDYFQWIPLSPRSSSNTNIVFHLAPGEHDLVVCHLDPGICLHGGILKRELAEPPRDVFALDRVITVSSNQRTVEFAVSDFLRNGMALFGDCLGLSAVSPARNGDVAVNLDRVAYCRSGEACGTDLFTYTLTDPAGNSAKGVITLTFGDQTTSTVR